MWEHDSAVTREPGAADLVTVTANEDQDWIWVDATHQRWKVYATYFMSLVQGSVLVAFFVAPNIDFSVNLLLYAMPASFVLFVLLMLSVKCRVCDEFVMYRAFRGNWMFRGLRSLKACPQCGARKNDDKLI